LSQFVRDEPRRSAAAEGRTVFGGRGIDANGAADVSPAYNPRECSDPRSTSCLGFEVCAVPFEEFGAFNARPPPLDDDRNEDPHRARLRGHTPPGPCRTPLAARRTEGKASSLRRRQIPDVVCAFKDAAPSTTYDPRQEECQDASGRTWCVGGWGRLAARRQPAPAGRIPAPLLDGESPVDRRPPLILTTIARCCSVRGVPPSSSQLDVALPVRSPWY
jgi:hypothetical protein